MAGYHLYKVQCPACAGVGSPTSAFNSQKPLEEEEEEEEVKMR